MVKHLLFAACALLVSGCPCGSGRPTLLYEGFDTRCDAAPCGWEITGEVASVATLHAGERGLRLASGAAIERAIPGLDERFAEDSVEALVRCEAGTRLRFTVAMADGERVISAVTAASERGAERFVVFAAPLTEDDGTPSTGGQPRLVRVEVEGPGACELDELFFFRGDESGCFG